MGKEKKFLASKFNQLRAHIFPWKKNKIIKKTRNFEGFLDRTKKH